MIIQDKNRGEVINLVDKITDVAIYLGKRKPMWYFVGYPFVFDREGLNVQGLYEYRSASGMAHIFNKGKVECDGELVFEGDTTLQGSPDFDIPNLRVRVYKPGEWEAEIEELHKASEIVKSVEERHLDRGLASAYFG